MQATVEAWPHCFPHGLLVLHAPTGRVIRFHAHHQPVTCSLLDIFAWPATLRSAPCILYTEAAGENQPGHFERLVPLMAPEKPLCAHSRNPQQSCLREDRNNRGVVPCMQGGMLQDAGSSASGDIPAAQCSPPCHAEQLMDECSPTSVASPGAVSHPFPDADHIPNGLLYRTSSLSSQRSAPCQASVASTLLDSPCSTVHAQVSALPVIPPAPRSALPASAPQAATPSAEHAAPSAEARCPAMPKFAKTSTPAAPVRPSHNVSRRGPGAQSGLAELRRASDSRSGRKTICRVVLACHQLHTQPCRPCLLPAAYTAPAYHVCQRRASSAQTHLNRFKCPEHKQSQCLKHLSRSNLRLCNKGVLVDQSRMPLVWSSCKTIRNINETKRFEPVRTIPSNPISYDCC